MTGAVHGNHKHGHAKPPSPTYKSWRAMKVRCTNPKHQRYPNYGGRGISVTNEWYSFATFLADMGERPEGKTLDRIEVNDHYYKDNCKWSTPLEQATNRQRSSRTACGENGSALAA